MPVQGSRFVTTATFRKVWMASSVVMPAQTRQLKRSRQCRAIQ